MHQVSLAALIKLARQAFEAQNDYLDFSDWKRHRCSQSTTVSYRFTVIHLEVWLFMFIHSLREGDFPLFITSLEIFVPWMFFLHDIHYARWLPVFLEQLKKNEEGTPRNSSVKGISQLTKLIILFSFIGVDQAHEQNNKVVKVDGGAIGILENETALLKWAVAGPIVSDLLNQAKIFQIHKNL